MNFHTIKDAVQETGFLKVPGTCYIYILAGGFIIFGVMEYIGEQYGWAASGSAKNPVVGNRAMVKAVAASPEQGGCWPCTISDHCVITGNIGSKSINTGK